MPKYKEEKDAPPCQQQVTAVTRQRRAFLPEDVPLVSSLPARRPRSSFMSVFSVTDQVQGGREEPLTEHLLPAARDHRDTVC